MWGGITLCENLCKLSRTRGYRRTQTAGAIGPLPLDLERSRLALPVQPVGSARGLRSGVEVDPNGLPGRASRGVCGVRHYSVGRALQSRVRIFLGWPLRVDEAESPSAACGSSLSRGYHSRPGDDDLGPRIFPD